ELQRVDDAHERLSAYFCLDVSKARLLDANDHDVTPAARPSRQTVVVTFGLSGSNIVVQSSEPWSGSSIC
ncbi:MAG TPA: hypothetical protein VGO26_02465, partial [Amnibacterium sp.]|nr:hypothetical protein [Amnibacterium sp.]